MRKEKKDPASKVAIYAMVDLDNQHAYALKVYVLFKLWELIKHIDLSPYH